MRNEEMERRCLNWARWKGGAGQGGLGFGGGSVWREVVTTSRYREAVVPTLDVEAEQTERGVAQLESYLKRTVEVYYLGTGTMVERCKILQIASATLYARIDKAHEALAAWLREQEARARHQRERVELIQASARPRVRT